MKYSCGSPIPSKTFVQACEEANNIYCTFANFGSIPLPATGEKIVLRASDFALKIDVQTQD